MTGGARVGLVLVSHSAALAAGLRDLVSQMAPGVRIGLAGGTETGDLGTSADLVAAAVTEADPGTPGGGAVILYDLGSARMSAELATEFLPPDQADRVSLVDAPFVEAAMAAAVTAAGGAPLTEVATAAHEAATTDSAPDSAPVFGPDPDAQAGRVGEPGQAGRRGGGDGWQVREVSIADPAGLHARPAAAVVRALAGLSAEVRLATDDGRSAPANSLTALLRLAVPPGRSVTVHATGPDAPTALTRVEATLTQPSSGETTPAPPAPGETTPAQPSSGETTLAQPSSGETTLAQPAPPTPEAARPATPDTGPTPGPSSTPAVPGGSAGTPAAPGDSAGAPAAPAGSAGAVSGVGAAPGHGVGGLGRLGLAEIRVPDEVSRGAAAERARLQEALRVVREELASGGTGSIGAAHRELLADPELAGAAEEAIDGGTAAPAAWWDAVVGVREALAGVPDPLIASRAADVADVGARVLGALTGEQPEVRVGPGTVVLADEVPPSWVPLLADQGAAALVLRAGGARSHAAVLSRAAGLPLVVGVAGALDGLPDGTRLLVDGTTGTVQRDPTDERLAELADRDAELVGPGLVGGSGRDAGLVGPGPVGGDAGAGASGAAGSPAGAGGRGWPELRAADGSVLRIAANVGSVADARAAVAAGAGGVGLLRTELSFTGRRDLPGEDEQVGWLGGILAECPAGPVVVRTIDLGGDKPVPALRLTPARHGFLGQRGLRLCLARPELFRTHLRAVLRAGTVRPIELMVPFVTEPAELAAARRALEEAAASLDADGVPYRWPEKIGMMVEIPTTAVDVRPFLPLADFLSVGSNDLAQYLAAADRTLDAVGGAYRAGEALIPGLVAGLSGPAREAGVPVAVCGDLAGDPEQAARLVAAGVTELSVAAPLIPRLRADLARRLP